MNKAFWTGFVRGLALGPLWMWLDRAINGIITVTTEDGTVVCITRQTKEGRVISVIWEAHKSPS